MNELDQLILRGIRGRIEACVWVLIVLIFVLSAVGLGIIEALEAIGGR